MVEISLSFFFFSLFLLLLKASRSNLAQFGGEAGRFAKNWGIVRPNRHAPFYAQSNRLKKMFRV